MKREGDIFNLFIPKSKHAQVTIFIIIAVIVVSVIISFFLFRGLVLPEIGEKPEKNPNAFLESCMEDKIKETIKTIYMQGGYIENPLNKTFKFEDDSLPSSISYLCYTSSSYLPCTPQEVKLIKHLEDEIYKAILEEMGNCFEKLKSSLEKGGYDVEADYRGFEVDLIKRNIVIPIDAELTMIKSGETTKHESFKIIIPSRIYELALMVQEIINSEATAGEFNHYSIFLYPEFDINKYRASDSSVIYRVRHENTDEEFRFAVRSGVMPSGFGMNFNYTSGTSGGGGNESE